MENTFQRPMVVQNVRLLQRKILPIGSRHPDQRRVVRRRPSSTPLTASPVYPCIYSPSRPTPR